MDPVTAFQVAAAAAQFAQMALQIGGRLKMYVERTIELPPELSIIQERLEMLTCSLSNIETQLRQDSQRFLDKQSELDALHAFLNGLNSRTQQLDKLIVRWLPDENDSRTDLILKGLRSLGKEKEIKTLSQVMIDDVQFLILHQLTINGRSEINVAQDNGQPPAGEVLAMFPEERHVRDLVQRMEILNEVNAIYEQPENGKPHVVILEGMGGQGKTQMALELCYQAKRSNKFSGLFWIDAQDTISVSRGFCAISQRLRPDRVFADEKDQVKHAKQLLENWLSRWLIVFDNYDDPRSFFINEYIPQSSHGCVLVTSRSALPSILGHIISVPGMTEVQGLQLFFSRSGHLADDATTEHAKSIIHRLGYLPLAIAQVGSYLSKHRDTLEIGEFLTYYEQRTEAILKSTPDVWEYLKHNAHSKSHENRIKSVFTTWDFSFEALQQTSNDDEKVVMLSVMAFFAISDVSESLFKSYFESFPDSTRRPSWLCMLGNGNSWSKFHFAEVVEELRSFSLVSTARRQDNDGFVHVSLHPLVRDWIILRLDDEHRTSYFVTASHMLGHEIVNNYWTMDFALSYGFRLAPSQRNSCLLHLRAWESSQRKYRIDQFPMLLTPLNRSTLALEGLFADFYVDSSLMSLALPWYEWLWHHCDQSIPPWPALRFQAGARRAETVSLQANANAKQNSVELAREAAEFSTHHSALSISGEYLVAMALSWDPTAGDLLEAQSILTRILTVSDLLPAQRQLFMVELMNTYYQFATTDEEINAVESLRQQIFEASESEGGANFRRVNWPLRLWEFCCGCSNHGLTRPTLVTEYVDAMALLVGDNHSFYYIALLSKAEMLTDQAKYLEAQEIFRICVSALEKAKAREDLLERALAGLGYTHLKLKQYSEAISLLQRSLLGYLRFPEPPWSKLEDLAENLAEAYEGVSDYNAWVFAADLRLYYISKMDPLYSTNPNVIIATVSANMDAFFAKEALDHQNQRISFESSQLLEHLNITIGAIIGEFRQQTLSPSTLNIAMASEDLFLNLETEVSGDEFSTLSSFSIRGWYIFVILLEAAWHFYRRNLYVQGGKAFALSKKMFEISKNISEDYVWSYIETLCNFLDWAVEGPPEIIRVQLIISWACSQLRQRIGASDAVALRFKECISQYSDLLPHLPPDEPFTAGFVIGREDQTQRQVSLTLSERLGKQKLSIINKLGIRSGKEEKSSRMALEHSVLLAKSPIKLPHRRQHSTEMALQAVLSVAASAGGRLTPSKSHGKQIGYNKKA